MSRKFSRTRRLVAGGLRPEAGLFIGAAVLYVAFAAYLYQPYFVDFHGFQYLRPVNTCLGAMGCFLLSRRWLSSFAGSFFAGAIYGFGPFSLGLVEFHSTAGFLAASVPWLFLPAAFGPKNKWRWLRVPLAALPFLAIAVFFQACIHYRLFPVHARAGLRLADLSGLIAPLVMAKRGMTLVGFYHIPIAALLMGLFMLLKARRLGVAAVFCLGVLLAGCGRYLRIGLIVDVSPIMWVCIPVLCCSVVIGVGIQGLVLVGCSDRKWVLLAGVSLGILAVVTLLLATKYFQVFWGLASEYARLLVGTAVMYILGAVALVIIFFMASTKLRGSALRWLILCAAIGVDIFLGAGYIIGNTL